MKKSAGKNKVTGAPNSKKPVQAVAKPEKKVKASKYLPSTTKDDAKNSDKKSAKSVGKEGKKSGSKSTDSEVALLPEKAVKSISTDPWVIEQTMTVKANVGEVWHALTDKDELENWWGEGVVIQPRVGGKFQERWEEDNGTRQLATGRIKVAKVNKEITFTWREKDWPKDSFTKCTFLIEPVAPGRNISRVTMKHVGWETLPEESRTQMLNDFKVGWSYHMKELKAYLDE